MPTVLPKPRCCFKHERFENQDGWRLMQISPGPSGTITVTGRNVNTFHTFIDIFALIYSGSEMTGTLLYSREFEEYPSEGTPYWYRYVSVVKSDCREIATCIGDKLEIIQPNINETVRSRRMDGEARCMCVREREIFIGFKESNKVIVYDTIQLQGSRVIVLERVQDGLDGPFDMTVSSDKLFVCIGRDSPESFHRSLVFQEETGHILSELTYHSGTRCYAWSITADFKSGLAAVVWLEKYYEAGKTQIALYSLNDTSVLFSVEVESSLLRIKISEAERMITGNHVTGEVNVYDMSDIFSYSHLKEQISSHLKTDDFLKLTNFFCLSKNETNSVLTSDTPVEKLLMTLEEKRVILPSNVDRLTEAFVDLRSSCKRLAEIYQRTRTPLYYKETIQKLYDDNQRMKEKLETAKELFGLQRLQLLPQVPGETHGGLIQSKRPVQNPANETYAVIARQSQSSSQLCLATTSLREISGRETHAGTENAFKIVDTTSLVASNSACSNVSSSEDLYFPESSIEDEFSKLLVKVAVELTNTHCVYLANYFNFPASKIDVIRKDNETPGITLFGMMKERNVINMYDVSRLQQALVDLKLKEINDSLVKPYQLKIDPSKYKQHPFHHQE